MLLFVFLVIPLFLTYTAVHILFALISPRMAVNSLICTYVLLVIHSPTHATSQLVIIDRTVKGENSSNHPSLFLVLTHLGCPGKRAIK